MKVLCKTIGIFGLLAVMAGCANTNTYDNGYSRKEMAQITTEVFDVDGGAAAIALKPVYKKYGAPQSYVVGNMSSTYESPLSRLYGSGEFRSKLSLPNHLFWRIDGQALTNMLDPIPTAHLVYETAELKDLEKKLETIG